MTAALIATSLLGVGGIALWATFYYAPPRHAGGGESTLTVAYLLARVESETSGTGRHRLRTVTLRGDLDEGDELAPPSKPECFRWWIPGCRSMTATPWQDTPECCGGCLPRCNSCRPGPVP
ncbi:hypothetical protein [Saccharopolyspora sp. ASAGF58]|uniref:hypothetical protein n=1 Tax=Saccharopolyspora sp. ASAGF58 TaxID=2719023 RepID=UPI001FF0CBDD|nr:hypothetical protein [Saccharopolyspora sp. ASAGF58]